MYYRYRVIIPDYIIMQIYHERGQNTLFAILHHSCCLTAPYITGINQPCEAHFPLMERQFVWFWKTAESGTNINIEKLIADLCCLNGIDNEQHSEKSNVNEWKDGSTITFTKKWELVKHFQLLVLTLWWAGYLELPLLYYSYQNTLATWTGAMMPLVLIVWRDIKCFLLI